MSKVVDRSLIAIKHWQNEVVPSNAGLCIRLAESLYDVISPRHFR